MNTMPLFEHIQILRKHLLRALLWVIGFSCLAFLFMEPIISYLKHSYQVFLYSSQSSTSNLQISTDLTAISVFEVMTMNIKIAFVIGLILSLPFVVIEIWNFVSPGLYKHERFFARLMLILSLVFFYSGILFGYYLIIPFFFKSALFWASKYANVMITYNSYFNTLTMMVLIFGIIFEVPVILSLLGISGVLTSETIVKNRRFAFLGSFIVGAILAPPDVLSMCLIALPLYAMIEISILFVRFFETKKRVDTKV